MSLFGPKTVSMFDCDLELETYLKGFAGPAWFRSVDFYDPSSVSTDRLERAIVDAANEMGVQLNTDRVQVKHGGLLKKFFTDGIELSARDTGCQSTWDKYVVVISEGCEGFRAYRFSALNSYKRKKVLEGEEDLEEGYLDTAELDWYMSVPVILQNALDALNAGKTIIEPASVVQVFDASASGKWGEWERERAMKRLASCGLNLDMDRLYESAYRSAVRRPEPGTDTDDCLEFIVKGRTNLDFAGFMDEVKYRMENVFGIPVVVTQVDPACGNERFVIAAVETGMLESNWDPYACVKVCDGFDTRLYVYQMDGAYSLALINRANRCATREDKDLIYACQAYQQQSFDYTSKMNLSFATSVAALNGWKAE